MHAVLHALPKFKTVIALTTKAWIFQEVTALQTLTCQYIIYMAGYFLQAPNFDD